MDGLLVDYRRRPYSRIVWSAELSCEFNTQWTRMVASVILIRHHLLSSVALF
jgi:hypothetical protein